MVTDADSIAEMLSDILGSLGLDPSQLVTAQVPAKTGLDTVMMYCPQPMATSDITICISSAECTS